MIIHTKFQLKELVWLIWENKIIVDNIKSIHYNLYGDNSGGIKYTTNLTFKDYSNPDFKNIINEEFKENQLFKTKEELISSL